VFSQENELGIVSGFTIRSGNLLKMFLLARNIGHGQPLKKEKWPCFWNKPETPQAEPIRRRDPREAK